ncbi:MAG: TonB-dependent receptor [Clostridia bacterium]|nr:TonB-dependent receptor [Clostridia bacterium]
MTRPTHLLLLLIMVTCFPFTLHAQMAALSGRVILADKQVPAADVAVNLAPGNHQTTTNGKGYFQFDQLPAGKYQLTAALDKYQDLQDTLILSADEMLVVALELQPEPVFLEGVEITAASFDPPVYLTSVVSRETIERMPARDVGEFLRSQPNVNSIRKGGSNLDPVVRGLKYSQVNVQTNSGQKIEGGCPNRMDPAASHIDINDVTRIEIMKGPYSMRYGSNFGAVLSLITEKAQPYETWQWHARAIKGWESNPGGTKEHVTLQGGNQKVFFALSANRHDYGNYEAGNGQEILSSYFKYSFAGEVGFVPAQHHQVRLTYRNSQGRDVWFPALPMDERNDNTQLYSATYRYRNNESKLQTIDASLYRSDVHHEMDNKWRPFSDTVVAVSTIDARNQGGRIDLGTGLKTGKLHAGLDFENIHKDGERVKTLIMQPNLPVKTEDLWKNATISNLGIFGEYQQQQSSLFKWVLSARLDYNHAGSDAMVLRNLMGGEMYRNDDTNSDYLNVGLSGGIAYKINSKLSLDMAVGRGVRSPDMVERFIILLPVGYDNYDYLGNPQLAPEKNHQVDATLAWSGRQAGSFAINGFYSYIKDYITGVRVPPSLMMPQTAGVVGVKQFQNIDLAHMYGFEFTWFSPEQFPLNINLSAAYTAGFNPKATRYIVANGQVVGTEIVKNDPLPEIPPFETNLRLNYPLLDNRLVPQIHLRWATAQNRVSQAYDEKASPSFFVTNINVSYQISELLSASAGVSNLLDAAYYEHLNRRIIGSQAALYEPGRSFYLNIILTL